jgi:hypothetical protein
MSGFCNRGRARPPTKICLTFRWYAFDTLMNCCERLQSKSSTPIARLGFGQRSVHVCCRVTYKKVHQKPIRTYEFACDQLSWALLDRAQYNVWVHFWSKIEGLSLEVQCVELFMCAVEWLIKRCIKSLSGRLNPLLINRHECYLIE